MQKTRNIVSNCRPSRLPPHGRNRPPVHDQNANGKVDAKWYGAPKEAYGMSTNPEPRRGRPKFEDGVFTLGEEPLSLKIVMRGGKR